jgi:hypothetical protein
MSDDSANTAVFTNNGKWPNGRPEGFGGVIPGSGRPAWLLTDEKRAAIIEAAKNGSRICDIGPIVGCAPNTFERKKREIPEIDDLIEEGRRQGRAELLQLSRTIITNPRDPARNQELARLHRLLKSEQPETAKDSDEKGVFTGYDIVLIKKDSSNSEPTA